MTVQQQTSLENFTSFFSRIEMETAKRLAPGMWLAWTQWRQDVGNGKWRPRAIKSHVCTPVTCRYHVYANAPDVYICVSTGDFHICNPRQCAAIQTHLHESAVYCTITGVQYALQPVAPTDRDAVDFGSKTLTTQQMPKKPGPRPKEVTTTDDSEHLRKTARAVLQQLLSASALVKSMTRQVALNKSVRLLHGDRSKNRKRSSAVAFAQGAAAPAPVAAATDQETEEMQQRFVSTAMQSWNTLKETPDFKCHMNAYGFEKHCLVVAYMAKDLGGFRSTHFTIAHEPLLALQLVKRPELQHLGLMNDYTTTVRLFRKLLASAPPPKT